MRRCSSTNPSGRVVVAGRRCGLRSRGIKPALEDLHRRVVAKVDVVGGCCQSGVDRSVADTGVIGDRLERRLRRQPDQFGLSKMDAILRRELTNRIPHKPKRRESEVEEVHRDLRAQGMAALRLADLESVRLQSRQPATRLADASGDALRQIDVVRVQVDVVGDQERARADGDRAGRRMHPSRPEVRLAAVLLDLDLQPLVLAAADIGEPLAVRPQRSTGVQVDGQVEAARDPFAERPCDIDDVVDRGRCERDEGDDVDGADPRVLALMGVHVDLVDRARHEPLERLAHSLMLTGHREHRAVVTRVAGPVEEEDLRDGRDRVREPVDDIEPPALRDIGHRFDEHRQSASSIGTRTPRSRATSIARS